jgi:hypothetical protein
VQATGDGADFPVFGVVEPPNLGAKLERDHRRPPDAPTEHVPPGAHAKESQAIDCDGHRSRSSPSGVSVDHWGTARRPSVWRAGRRPRKTDPSRGDARGSAVGGRDGRDALRRSADAAAAPRRPTRGARRPDTRPSSTRGRDRSVGKSRMAGRSRDRCEGEARRP